MDLMAVERWLAQMKVLGNGVRKLSVEEEVRKRRRVVESKPWRSSNPERLKHTGETPVNAAVKGV